MRIQGWDEHARMGWEYKDGIRIQGCACKDGIQIWDENTRMRIQGWDENTKKGWEYKEGIGIKGWDENTRIRI